MFDISKLVDTAIGKFFSGIFDQLIKFFGTTLAKVMSSSLDVLNLPLVQNGIKYTQALALTILVLKTMKESFETYILYQNGDSDADPAGLLVRTGQAVAVIVTLPWIVLQVFTFGNKVALDVAGLSSGKAGISDWAVFTGIIATGQGTVAAIFAIIIVICILIVAIQATIRGAELALMSVLGPIMALNLTANNKSVWSAWFRQLIIICSAQGIQIFMLDGALSLLTNKIESGSGLLLIFGWLWVTIKSPKYIQQFAYSTGLTNTVGGTAKQVSSAAIMQKVRTMMGGA